jgi:hypothetical protein
MKPERISHVINHHFNLDDLRALCAQLHVDYEDLSGSNTRISKSNELVQYLYKRGRLLELFEAVERERPQVDLRPCFHELIAQQFNTVSSMEQLFAALDLPLRNFQERERLSWGSSAWVNDKAQKLQTYFYERGEWTRLLQVVAAQSKPPTSQETVVRLFSTETSPTPPSTKHKTLRKALDAAIRREVEIGKATYLLVLIRDSASDGLRALLKTEPDYLLEEDDVKTSRAFRLKYPVDGSGNLLPAPVEIVVTAPDFDPPSQSIYTEIEPPTRPDEQPEPVEFMLTPLAAGELQLMVEVFQVMGEKSKRIGAKPVHTISKDNPSPLAQYRVISLMFKTASTPPLPQIAQPSSVTNIGKQIIIQGDATMSGDTFNMSGNFSGAVLNIKSKLDNVTQTVNNMPNTDSSERQELQGLIEQLKAELEKVPPELESEAEAVAQTTELLIETASADKPNKTMIEITGEGLKKAAENIAGVMPTVLTIATQIVFAISKVVR